MKDLISKLTFGFLMAQFVPGVITVCSLGLLCGAYSLEEHDSIVKIAKELSKYLSSVEAKLMFIALCTGAGMLIHGVHWAVLAFLETVFRKEKDGEVDRRAIYETFWHKLPVFLQVLLGPIIMLFETLGFLVLGGKIKCLATSENVIYIRNDKMGAFNFIQDFYLHFAQFYAHTAYALLIAFVSLLIFVWSFGTPEKGICLLIIVYVLTGVFFVVGRIQLATLFIAEHEMCGDEG